jgi:hypothetical protein
LQQLEESNRESYQVSEQFRQELLGKNQRIAELQSQVEQVSRSILQQCMVSTASVSQLASCSSSHCQGMAGASGVCSPPGCEAPADAVDICMQLWHMQQLPMQAGCWLCHPALHQTACSLQAQAFNNERIEQLQQASAAREIELQTEFESLSNEMMERIEQLQAEVQGLLEFKQHKASRAPAVHDMLSQT